MSENVRGREDPRCGTCFNARKGLQKTFQRDWWHSLCNVVPRTPVPSSPTNEFRLPASLLGSLFYPSNCPAKKTFLQQDLCPNATITKKKVLFKIISIKRQMPLRQRLTPLCYLLSAYLCLHSWKGETLESLTQGPGS